MSEPSPLLPDDEDELLAAEYVLGVLDLPERARAERLIKHSPDFAAYVALWEARLSPLAEDVAPIPVRNLLPSIEQRLFGRVQKKGLSKWLSRRTGWLGSLIGTAAMSVMAVLVMALMLQWAGGPVEVVQETVLRADNSEVQYTVRARGDLLAVSHTKGPLPNAGRSYELWLIDGDAAPVSLGLIDVELLLPRPPLLPPACLSKINFESLKLFCAPFRYPCKRRERPAAQAGDGR
jgi:anti-sigma-K factor RskA